jgi:Fic family protein
MAMSEQSTQMVSEFRGIPTPEPLRPVGYAALIDRYQLKVPLPRTLAGIAARHHPVSTNEWRVLTPRHQPTDDLYGHLEFALKWEGVNLGVLAALFRTIKDEEVAAFVNAEPMGTYSRRLWFLHEWLTRRQLDIREPGKIKAVPVLNSVQQFGITECVLSSRHKVIDNLPGTRAFCPLVWRTEALEKFLAKGLDAKARKIAGRTRADIMERAAAFLLLNDSRASFKIEGEKPSPQRTERWAKAIGEAGTRKLTTAELERLQKIVIGDTRFVHVGLRTQAGFVGTHDRRTQEPIPVHISARPEDLKNLVDGIVAYDQRVAGSGIDAVVLAAAISFGFVYIHPFEDGNGRLHRWLIHHVLAVAGYNPAGVVFPVSAAIYREIPRYTAVLESYSRSLLEFIEWEPTPEGNVRILNDTADYYRYFDATAHAEFLYGCVEEMVNQDLPQELAYLEAYDRFSRGVQGIADMPDRQVNLLHRFLSQGNGRLSKRARTEELAALTDAEVQQIEQFYQESFADVPQGGEEEEE